MTTVDVTIIDPVSSEGQQRDLVTRLSAALRASDHDAAARERKGWVVIARAVRPETMPARGANQHLASLDYAAWHDHLAGIRRWVPGGEGATAN
jgi:hypothetical protein